MTNSNLLSRNLDTTMPDQKFKFEQHKNILSSISEEKFNKTKGILLKELERQREINGSWFKTTIDRWVEVVNEGLQETIEFSMLTFDPVEHDNGSTIRTISPIYLLSTPEIRQNFIDKLDITKGLPVNKNWRQKIETLTI